MPLILASGQSAAKRRQAQGALSNKRAESQDREPGTAVTDSPSPKAAYAGALGDPYITTQHQPAAAFAVAVPNPAGGYRRKNSRWADTQPPRMSKPELGATKSSRNYTTGHARLGFFIERRRTPEPRYLACAKPSRW